MILSGLAEETKVVSLSQQGKALIDITENFVILPIAESLRRVPSCHKISMGQVGPMATT